MSKQQESAADRIWKEKLDIAVSLREAVVTIVLVCALAGALLVL